MDATITSRLTRKSLGRRLEEALTARGYRFTIATDDEDRLVYVVQTPYSPVVAGPGALASMLGIPLMDDGR